MGGWEPVRGKEGPGILRGGGARKRIWSLKGTSSATCRTQTTQQTKTTQTKQWTTCLYWEKSMQGEKKEWYKTNKQTKKNTNIQTKVTKPVSPEKTFGHRAM